MEQMPPFKEYKMKKSSTFLRVLPWVGTVLFFVVTAFGIYYFATTQPQKVVSQTTMTTAASSTSICNDAIVSAYNTASKLQLRTGNTDLAPDLAALVKLDTTIRTKKGFEQDPTCQTILFWNAIINNDTGRAGVALKAVQNLHDAHYFADTNLDNITSISVMKDSLNIVVAGPKV